MAQNFERMLTLSKKASRMDINTTPQLAFAETSEKVNPRVCMDTEGTLHPESKTNSYFFVICDAFTHFVVNISTHLKDAETAADVLLKKWIIFFGH